MLSKVNFFVVLFLLFRCSVDAQVVRNESKMNISGGYFVISGSYQSEGQGGIILDGVVTVTGNWTNNGSGNGIDNPDTNGEVIFNGAGNQIIGGSSGVCDFEKLTINNGSITQVEAGKGVSSYGACTFSSPLVLKTTTTKFRPVMATFINHSTVSGNIKMELSYSSTGTSASGAGRGLYFSSPISNGTAGIFNVAHGTNLLWYQNEVTRQYVKVVTNSSPLTIAKGYILRAPIDTVVNFTGTPNTASSYTNNNIPRAVTGQFYLFGNPYPSVVDWDAISTKTNLVNTIWYQSSSTAGTPMVVDTWNGDSQVGTANNGTAPVDGKIPPMQSFWVQCASVGQIGTLTVDESTRTHNWGSSKFLKSMAQNSNKSVVRLALFTNTLKDEAIVVESESAQDAFDSWDSRKMLLKDANRAEVYSISPEKTNLVIQSIKPITTEKIIRLGISIGTAGEYKFNADLTNTINPNNYYLEDKQLHILQNLNVNPVYTFTSGVIDDTSRFVIRYLQSPVVIAKSSLTSCSPNEVDLTSSSVTEGSTSDLTFDYWLNNAATSPYLTPNSTKTGAYYVRGLAHNGTYSVAGPIDVIINPSPNLIINNPAEVIEPATVDLTSPEITLGSTDGLSFTYWTDKTASIPYDMPQFAVQGEYYIKGTLESTGCFSIAGPVKVIVTSNSTNTGTTSTDNSLIYSYANQIHLQNFEINSTISIFDVLGRQQYYGILKSDHEIINTNLTTGIYIVKVANSKVVKSKKVYIK